MISLALTHFQRPQLLLEAVADVLDESRIREIVVVDDASMDDSWQFLQSAFEHEPKVRLTRNQINQDCYRNKAIAVQECRHDWVILFDSDNIITPEYLDRLEEVLPWDEDTAYLPTFAEPHFDYRAYEGVTVSRANVASYMEDVTFRTALNTANCLFYRSRYLEAFDPHAEPHTADSIYMNYRWLAAGGKLHFVPGLKYFHRVHEGSHYQNNVHRTGSFAARVEEALRDL